jgi:hypothetical protein
VTRRPDPVLDLVEHVLGGRSEQAVVGIQLPVAALRIVLECIGYRVITYSLYAGLPPSGWLPASFC